MQTSLARYLILSMVTLLVVCCQKWPDWIGELRCNMPMQEVAAHAKGKIQKETVATYMGSHRIDIDDHTNVWLEFEDDRLKSYALFRTKAFPPLTFESSPTYDLCRNLIYYRIRVEKDTSLGEYEIYSNGSAVDPLPSHPNIIKLRKGFHHIEFRFKEGTIKKDLSLTSSEGEVELSLSSDDLQSRVH